MSTSEPWGGDVVAELHRQRGHQRARGVVVEAARHREPPEVVAQAERHPAASAEELAHGGAGEVDARRSA